MLRIQPPVLKVVYVALGLAVIYIVDGLVGAYAREVAAFLAGPMIFILTIAACRTFRGPSEEVKPPRPWWQATSESYYGAAMSLFWLLAAVYGVATVVSLTLSHRNLNAPVHNLSASLTGAYISAAVTVLLLVFFVQSTVRIRRASLKTA